MLFIQVDDTMLRWYDVAIYHLYSTLTNLEDGMEELFVTKKGPMHPMIIPMYFFLTYYWYVNPYSD